MAHHVLRRSWAHSVCAALLIACGGELPSKQPGTVLPPTPLCAASDPAQVVAPQQIVLLTSTQLMNMIRLVSDDAARSIVDGGIFSVTSDFAARFPPARFEPFKSIPDATSLSVFTTTAQKVGEYVRDHFSAVTTCPSPATDACATRYLDTLAGKAYRRPLTADEQARFRSLYDDLRTAIVKDQSLTLTVEEATGFAVQALLLSPQLLWRWEVGAETSSSPPGVFLTDAELASNLSFFLTDGPPDDALRADASAGTLRANLGAHVDRILATPAARQWLTHVMQTYFLLNQLPGTIIDSGQVPDRGGRRPLRRPLSRVPAVPRRRDVERQGHGSADVAKGVPQQQPRVHDLRRPGARGSDGDALHRNHAPGRRARRHAHRRAAS